MMRALRPPRKLLIGILIIAASRLLFACSPSFAPSASLSRPSPSIVDELRALPAPSGETGIMLYGGRDPNAEKPVWIEHRPGGCDADCNCSSGGFVEVYKDGTEVPLPITDLVAHLCVRPQVDIIRERNKRHKQVKR